MAQIIRKIMIYRVLVNKLSGELIIINSDLTVQSEIGVFKDIGIKGLCLVLDFYDDIGEL